MARGGGPLAGVLAMLGLFCVETLGGGGWELECSMCRDRCVATSAEAPPGQLVALNLLHVVALRHMRDRHPDVSSLAAEVLGA